MLVVSRRGGQRIQIRVGNVVVWVMVVELRPGVVRLGLEGPPEAVFMREEIADEKRVEAIRIEGESVALDEGRL